MKDNFYSKFIKIFIPSLVLTIILILGSCVFNQESVPILLSIKNSSSKPISKIEIWEGSKESEKATWEVSFATLELSLAPTDDENLVNYFAALGKLGLEEAKIMVKEPLISDSNKLTIGSSRAWEIQTHTPYIIRVNKDIPYSINISKSEVLLYTDNGFKSEGD